MTTVGTQFVNGSTFAQAATCSVRENVFYSYATPIAVRKDGRFYLTLDKFSKTTTTQQKALLELIPSRLCSVVPHETIIELVG